MVQMGQFDQAIAALESLGEPPPRLKRDVDYLLAKKWFKDA